MPYTTKSTIGRGGFGVVERVENEIGEVFARKTLIIPPSFTSIDIRRRFDREVKYQSALDHENVVKILESNLQDDPPWFIMSLAECSLYDDMIIDRTLGGDPKKALFDTLAGLEEVHRKGYLHRDLKPQNILKFYLDGKYLYAISDFGLMAVGEDASTTLTSTGMAGGTLRYQAPECASDFRRASVRSDIYSFGAILHDIFATNIKRLPHEELTVPGDLGPVVEKCTKRNSHRRFKNVEELRQALFLALDVFEFKFESDEEEQVVGLLTNEDALPDSDGWDKVFDFLDENEKDARACGNVFRALRTVHIEQVAKDQIELLDPLGKIFADYARKNSFDFDYCDVIATKAQVFYDVGDLPVKAHICLAMLELGASHNRWFVERKFMRMANTSISDDLADRIKVEVDVLEMHFSELFQRLRRSITADKNELHPIIRALC